MVHHQVFIDSMIKNIIFDFGGVILKHKSTLLEDKISEIFSIPSEQALEIWKKVKADAFAGKISSEQFLKQIKDQLHSDKPLPEILKQWTDIYAREAKNVDWELMDFIENLKRKFKVYLLTDTIDTHDQYNATRGIYEKFNKVFKSHEEGLTKLNDDAFINVLNKISAPASECVFIDDLEVNVNRAKNLGFEVILYRGKEDLKQKMSRLGITIS